MGSNLVVRLAEFPNLVLPVLKAKLPVMVRGPHGSGKTESIRQTVDKLGYTVLYQGSKNTPIHSDHKKVDGKVRGYRIERRASQMQEGDLLGMPSAKASKVNGEDSTKWNPPEWLAFACAYPCVVFLDEVDRATGEVRQGIFQLLDSRCVGDQHLHEDSIVIAAINGGEYGNEYQVNALDPAELSRWFVVDIAPEFSAWLDWANKSGVSPLVKDFLIQHQDQFADYDGMDGVKKHPEPRSWDRCSKVFNAAGFDLNYAKENPEFCLQLVAGFVGVGAAGKWSNWVREQENAITLERALQDPDAFKKQMKKLKSDEERQQRVIELCSQISQSNTWLKYCNNDESNLDKKGVIKASYFLDYTYEFMKSNKELFFTFLHDMIFGIQTKYLAPIAENASMSKQEKEDAVFDIIFRLKALFKPGLTTAQYKDQAFMKNSKFSLEHPICKELVAIVEANQEEVQKWIDSKQKKTEE